MTIGIIVAVLFIVWISMPKSLESDLVTNLRRSHCFIRRQHMDPREIGMLTKKGGFKPVPMKQCAYCYEIYVASQDAATRFGAKVTR